MMEDMSHAELWKANWMNMLVGLEAVDLAAKQEGFYCDVETE